MLFLGLVAFGALALGLRVAVIETDLEQLWVEGELPTLAIAALLYGAQDRDQDEELATEPPAGRVKDLRHLPMSACVSGHVGECLPLPESPSVL